MLKLIQGNDKRDGAGAGNWGTPEDELKAQTEPVADEVAKEEAEKKDEAPPAAPEPEEPKTMTLEEYRKQKKSVLSNPNAKTQSQTAATTQKVPINLYNNINICRGLKFALKFSEISGLWRFLLLRKFCSKYVLFVKFCSSLEKLPVDALKAQLRDKKFKSNVTFI